MSHENCIFSDVLCSVWIWIEGNVLLFLKLDVMRLMISIACNTKAQKFVEVPFQGNWPNITSTLIETKSWLVLFISQHNIWIEHHTKHLKGVYSEIWTMRSLLWNLNNANQQEVLSVSNILNMLEQLVGSHPSNTSMSEIIVSSLVFGFMCECSWLTVADIVLYFSGVKIN